jgi:hypothetical protein
VHAAVPGAALQSAGTRCLAAVQHAAGLHQTLPAMRLAAPPGSPAELPAQGQPRTRDTPPANVVPAASVAELALQGVQMWQPEWLTSPLAAAPPIRWTSSSPGKWERSRSQLLLTSSYHRSYGQLAPEPQPNLLQLPCCPQYQGEQMREAAWGCLRHANTQSSSQLPLDMRIPLA